jgi:hypothetical protein
MKKKVSPQSQAILLEMADRQRQIDHAIARFVALDPHDADAIAQLQADIQQLFTKSAA